MLPWWLCQRWEWSCLLVAREVLERRQQSSKYPLNSTGVGGASQGKWILFYGKRKGRQDLCCLKDWMAGTLGNQSELMTLRLPLTEVSNGGSNPLRGVVRSLSQQVPSKPWIVFLLMGIVDHIVNIYLYHFISTFREIVLTSSLCLKNETMEDWHVNILSIYWLIDKLIHQFIYPFVHSTCFIEHQCMPGSGNTTVLKIGIILSLHLESSWETDSQHVSKQVWKKVLGTNYWRMLGIYIRLEVRWSL